MAVPLQRIEGKYEIIGKIRDGGMGAVYRVRHRLLDEIRVIKVLRPQAGQADQEEEELRTRFAQEARAAIRLRHPNVVQIFDFTLDEDGVGFIVMEHIDGVDLGQVLSGPGQVSVALAIELVRQALRAMGYLHRQGFVHRDVSPDNLMLTHDHDGDPLVKMIDLGIAKHRESERLTVQGAFVGKFRYASPEHFESEGANRIDPRSDLYALGLVLYELLTGEHPISGQDAPALVAGHLFRPPRPFEESDPEARVPEDLRAIVMRVLAKDPEQRFADAEAFAAALATVQERLPVDRAVRREAAGLVSHQTRPLQVEATKPGSTQHRLDHGFGLGRTPSPAVHGLVASEVSEPAGSEAPSELQRILATVDQLIADDLLVEADRALFQACERFGEQTPELRAQRERLDEIHRQHRHARIDELIARAEELAGEGAFDRALDCLHRARAAAVAGSERENELAERGAEMQRRANEHERHQAMLEAERTVLRMIRERRFEEADQVLSGAEGRFGNVEPFDTLREILDRTRREDTGAERVTRLLGEARKHLEARRFDAAVERLRTAAELDPDDAWIHARLAEAEAGLADQQERQRQRDDEVARIVAAVDERVAADDGLEAWKILRAAIDELGPLEPLLIKRRDLADIVLDE